MVREKQEDWTATAITLPTLFGLKISAAKHKRSIGQELEHILIQAGIKRMTESQYNAIIKEIERSAVA